MKRELWPTELRTKTRKSEHSRRRSGQAIGAMAQEEVTENPRAGSGICRSLLLWLSFAYAYDLRIGAEFLVIAEGLLRVHVEVLEQG